MCGVYRSPSNGRKEGRKKIMHFVHTGGGIALSEGARLELDACRLSTNTAPRGGGMWIAGPGSHMTRTDAAVVTENAARAGAGTCGGYE